MMAAATPEGVIGNNGNLPWHKERKLYKGDLQRFRDLTMGHSVVMGRATEESLPKSLGGRQNIILSRNPEYIPKNGGAIARNRDEALSLARLLGTGETYIIGGQPVFEQFMPIADKIELTRIHKSYEGDRYFPVINLNEWVITDFEQHEHYDFITYGRPCPKT